MRVCFTFVVCHCLSIHVHTQTCNLVRSQSAISCDAMTVNRLQPHRLLNYITCLRYQPNHNSTGIPIDAKCDGDGSNCGRGTFDASPPARDFADYFMSGFKTVARRGQPAAVMCAYNAIYGTPACASPINNDIVRDSWGWDGFFISDWCVTVSCCCC